jgi:phosphoglycolate phosphatase-like HAD superfamily hydrolase
MNADIVFLIDVDNTLLDNDRIIADLREHVASEFGAASAEHYWSFIEDLRDELGYVDYLGALQRYRTAVEHDDASAQHLLGISSFLLDYPFSERLYPGALEVLARLGKVGPPCSFPTATSSSSRARCSGQACGVPSPDEC